MLYIMRLSVGQFLVYHVDIVSLA